MTLKFERGVTVFTAHLGPIKEYLIIDKPSTNGIHEVKVVRIGDLRVMSIFLGDLGAPGHAYDDRPCVVFATREEAEDNYATYTNWLNRYRVQTRT